MGLAVLACSVATGANAACNQELAVYADRDGVASLEFVPVTPHEAVTTHRFRVLFSAAPLVLDGIVMVTEGIARSHGIVMHRCPDGDVTGEEIAACTVWEGPIYGLTKGGEASVLPAHGQSASEAVLLAGFAPGIAGSPAYATLGVTALPWDGFRLSGCQE